MDASTRPKPFKRPINLENISWSVSTQGELTTVKANLIDYEPQRIKSRGIVRGFSRSARLRLLKLIAKMEWSKVKCGLFITVTLPDEVWPMDKEKRNRVRYLFLRDMENYLGHEIAALWRIEWQKRQTGTHRGKFLPHFHLIVPNVRFIPWQVIRESWRTHLRYEGPLATDVDSLSNRKKQAVYIAKYAAKTPEISSLDYGAYLNIEGRHWGLHRPTLIPLCRETTFTDLPDNVVKRLRATAASELPWYDPQFDAGFSIFGKFGRRLVKAVEKLCLDNGLTPE